MGLYLCVFDGDEELEGVEVGSYADFGAFRKLVLDRLEGGNRGSKYPVLMLHPDSDGEWSVEEAQSLARELREISEAFRAMPAIDHPKGSWQEELLRKLGGKPKNLAESLFDVDGEPLLERIEGLCRVSQSSHQPILFQ